MAATALPLRSRRRSRGASARGVGDERLVARVRAGDDDAFEAIYDRYYRGLLAFCRHMLGSREEAEDTLQHSFASAYRALRRGESEVDLRPWLYTIARNRCLSALRARRDEVDIDGVDVDRGSFDGLPVQVQLRAELRDMVEDLRRLPDSQRAALVLFELGDHSHDEIAAVLGVRREKVKALVFQARAGLLRAKRAREASCDDVREQLASLVGRLPKRGMVKAHLDRCDGCAAFEREVRRQRAALAMILPVVPSAGLKASVLAVALGGGGGGAAALTGATVGGAAAGGGTLGGALGAAGVATVAGGVVTGTTNVAPGLSALGAKGLVTKFLAVVAVAGGTGEARQAAPQAVAKAPAAATLVHAPAISHAPAGATVRRHTSKPSARATRERPSTSEPADAPAQQSAPPPDATNPVATPAPASAPAPAPQHASMQPAATSTAAAPDPAPQTPPATTTPEPQPPATTATSDPAPTPATTASTETAPAAIAPTTAPAATIASDPGPGTTASTLSRAEAAPAASAPAAAATGASG